MAIVDNNLGLRGICFTTEKECFKILTLQQFFVVGYGR